MRQPNEIEEFVKLFGFKKNIPTFCGLMIGGYDTDNAIEKSINERQSGDIMNDITLDCYAVYAETVIGDWGMIEEIDLNFQLLQPEDVNDGRELYRLFKNYFDHNTAEDSFAEEMQENEEWIYKCCWSISDDFYCISVDKDWYDNYYRLSITPKKKDMDIYKKINNLLG